ncbi:PAS domain-containing sensor histidine kinase [Bacillus litorisediminis]|uniref:PAS domain-containing sensor histidine kinase n=1 Tax=Bacillus litorisediminis TaxID=2922713 RepID=UPI001FAB5DE8|nr:PAS domain-containing sensor histidine kinase [Bacillus litorisediminis]
MNEQFPIIGKEEYARLKKRVKELEERVSITNTFYQNSLDAAILLQEDLKIVEVNQAAVQLFEENEETLLRKSILDFLSLVPKEIYNHQRSQLKANGQHVDELLLTLGNSKVKHVQYIGINVVKPKHDLMIIRDISFSREMEREQAITSHMFSDVFKRAVDGIVFFNKDGIIVDVNPSFTKSLNTTKEKIIGRKLEEMVPSDFHYKLCKQWKHLMEMGIAKGELPFKMGDTQCIFEFSTSSNIHNGLYMSIMRDITEKKEMEVKIKKNEQLFADLFEGALDAIVLWDHSFRIVKANEAACRLFECTYEELLTKKLDDFVYKKDEHYKSIFNRLNQSDGIRAETLFLMPNGQMKLIEFTSRSHSIDGYNMTILRNVSEQRQMEKELRESEQKFRRIFEGSLDGFILWTDNYQIVDINHNGTKILELEKKDCLGKKFNQLLGNKIEGFREIKRHLGALRQKGHDHGNLSITLINKRKKHIEFSTKLNILKGLNLTIFRDVTERLEMQEQLRKSDTLNVVGELAAGIAHEIRNPMTALKGFIQLLQSSVKEDHSMYFNVITSELQRIESIITEFLVLAKPQAVHYLKKDIVQIMKETLELLHAQAMMHNVQFQTIFYRDIPKIYCEPNQLKQVFINIIKNAIEAMPKGGVITVTIQKYINHTIRISIRDEGSGISKERLKKLGEPFYTTKERGTGLGLMVSYKIIEEHSGLIEVESEVGDGTVFHIILPIRERESNHP